MLKQRSLLIGQVRCLYMINITLQFAAVALLFNLIFLCQNKIISFCGALKWLHK